MLFYENVGSGTMEIFNFTAFKEKKVKKVWIYLPVNPDIHITFINKLIKTKA